MKAKELRGKVTQELQKLEQEWAEEIFRLHFKRRSQQLASPARLQQLRRDQARLKTILQERSSGN
ncbi:MAG: 50S ribosomal protein L29 [Deltaproteobacteria bacterium]|nr:50S ribosomal protein L29 [Deltaproteobacteria bacterium]